MKKTNVLCIMDGFGHNPSDYGNAVAAAKKPSLDMLMEKYPYTYIGASGLNVGLPDGQMGNSEVGHTNMGAGRVVYQELTRITKSIEDGDFFENEALCKAINKSIEDGTSLHLMGLMSDGGVHSHNSHIFAIVELAKRLGQKKVYLHCIMDGRDVPPTSGKDYVADAINKMNEIGVGKVATVTGRYYAMDRDNNFDRVKKAYDAFVFGKGIFNTDPVDAIKKSYETVDGDGKNLTDEFILPTVTLENEGRIGKGDSVVFFNFRPDRAREITRTFVDTEFTGFEREYFPVNYVCMTQYDATMPNVDIAFKPQVLTNTFGEYLANRGMTQLRIAETEKYAHVTFFFNGGVEAVNEGEDRILIPSPKVATYDLKPEMSAFEVSEKLNEAVRSGKYDVVIVNFANCDMVGHTGVFDAAVKAVEAVDTCVGTLYEAVIENGGTLFVTADHGNADVMKEPDGSPFTAHTTNLVPFIAVNCGDVELREGGKLCDIVPTMLKVMNLPQPEEMTGVSIIK
ncbi:MAG: 2,3-bisphosphoglycerate-independent phosphoglycerate mutase [Eubacterium sp.]|nr:2,3-bisphosphoglycerate-independent phosphoglycerate mutase [Eubacterium sp.]